MHKKNMAVHKHNIILYNDDIIKETNKYKFVTRTMRCRRLFSVVSLSLFLIGNQIPIYTSMYNVHIGKYEKIKDYTK